MEKWEGKLAVVTGASAGIGIAIVKSLVGHGINVVGLARRVERVEVLSSLFTRLSRLKTISLSSVSGARERIKRRLGESSRYEVRRGRSIIGEESFRLDRGALWRSRHPDKQRWRLQVIDATSNFPPPAFKSSSFISRFVRILDEGDEVNDELKKIVDVNLMGTVFCTRAAFQTMKTRDLGYVININSITGHFIPFPTEDVASYNTYAASKHGVTAVNEVLRQELACSEHKHKIRVTSLSPGEVRTEMMEASGFQGSVEDYFASVELLYPEDIAEGVIYILSTPPRVNVTELTIRPTGERA